MKHKQVWLCEEHQFCVFTNGVREGLVPSRVPSCGKRGSVGKVRKSPVTMCLVRGCPYKPISFGLCGGHYTDYKKSKEHKTEVATYELLATHFVGPCASQVYRKRLLTITKGPQKSNGRPRRTSLKR